MSEAGWPDLAQMASGTSRKGQISLSYASLVSVLGEATLDGDGCAVDAEWVVETPHGIVTVYNYRNGPSYLRSGDIGNIREWHIGARSQGAAEYLIREMAGRLLALPA